MRTVAFDGRTGAGGDLMLGSLIDAGADPDNLAPVADALDVSYEIERVTVNGIEAVDVTVADGDESAGEQNGESTRGDHTTNHRTRDDIVSIVDSMAVSDRVKDRSIAIVDALADAEAAVHGSEADEIAVHEVGADDAIADIVGATILLEDLDADRIVTTPLAAGGGETQFSHGTYPVPSPAVIELAERADWTLDGGPEPVELLTPTGAAILGEVAEGVDSLPPMAVESTGYGAGDHALEDRPNVLRVLIGEEQGQLIDEELAVLETNVDDVSPEVLGSLHESLTAVGARDVSIVPLTMKQSRPGHLVRVITAPEDADRVARRLAEETGTLGVRRTAATHRWIANREKRTVRIEANGDQYDVQVKVATDDTGAGIDISTEYEDARRVAERTGLPVRTILQRAESAAYDEFSIASG